MDLITKIMLIVFAAFVALILLVKIISDVQTFRADLDYVNCEIRRCDPRERDHWIREKKRLWLSLFFPFIKF